MARDRGRPPALNILHLVWGSAEAYGGIETHVRNLCRAMNERGHPSAIAALPSLRTAHRISPQSPEALPLMSLPEALKARLQGFGADVAISHNLYPAATGGVPVLVAGALKSQGIPHVGVIHDVYESRSDQRDQGYRDATIVTVSRVNAELIRRRLNITAAAVIPPLVDVAGFEVTPAPDDQVIAFPARLSPQKGVDAAVRLVGYLSGELGPITLLLSQPGSGAFGEEAAFVEQLRREADSFPDLCLAFNEADGVAAMYQRAAMTLVTPIGREGYGMTPAESLASGRPVVAGPTGGMGWVSEAPGVLAVSGADILAICRGVAEVLGQRQTWLRRALEGRAWVEQRFDPDVICAAYLKVCGDALASTGALKRTEVQW